MTRGSFFCLALSSFSEDVDTSVRSLSSDAEAAEAEAALARPFFAPGFLPGDVAGLTRLLPLPALRSRSVLSDGGTGTREAAGMM